MARTVKEKNSVISKAISNLIALSVWSDIAPLSSQGAIGEFIKTLHWWTYLLTVLITQPHRQRETYVSDLLEKSLTIRQVTEIVSQ
ncbi:hypothetical protein ACKFKG_05820 [Phormidesmis sp. 146-35]